MTTTLYKHKTSARAAALKALGKGAEFEIVTTDDGRFYWIDTSEAAAEAAGAENDPPEPVKAENEEEVFTLPVMGAGNEELIYLPPAETFDEPEEKADLKVDLGITPELAALIYGLGETAGAAIPVPQKRKGITSDAWAAAERGELPAPMNFPASNSYAKLHADNLRHLADTGNKAGLEAYPIGGTNTYSKALRSYREALLTFLANTYTPMKEAA